MAKTIKVVVTGDKELDKALRELAGKETNAEARKALRRSTKIVLDEVKTTVPVQRGNLRRSMTVRSQKRKKRGSVAYVVTQRDVPENPSSADKKKAFYGSFLEMGYRVGKRAGRKTSAPDERKKIEGRWFMRQAGTRKEREATEYWRDQLWLYVLGRLSK